MHKPMAPLLAPTPEAVLHYGRRFDEEGPAVADAALTELFGQFPRNDRLEHVLLKVTALNTLYGTGILAVHRVAEAIWQRRIDARLAEGAPELVNEIAPTEIKGKTRRNYSFASKYCHWHAPETYPIFDSVVERLLWDYCRQDRYADFRRGELWDYPHYKAIVEQFRRHYGLEPLNFKALDKFLWLYGKERYAG